MNLDKVLPNLFVGSCPKCVEDIDRLKEAGITAVLNVQTEDDFDFWGELERLAASYRQEGIKVRRVPVRDFDPDHLQERLPECVEALDELLRSGHTVYVHCTAGVNRSPTVVIAYLHWVKGKDLGEAVKQVQKCHPCEPYVEAIRLASEDRKRDSTPP